MDKNVKGLMRVSQDEKYVHLSVFIRHRPLLHLLSLALHRLLIYVRLNVVSDHSSRDKGIMLSVENCADSLYRCSLQGMACQNKARVSCRPPRVSLFDNIQ